MERIRIKASDLKRKLREEMLGRGHFPTPNEVAIASMDQLNPELKDYETARSYTLAKSARHYRVFNS